MWTLQRRLIYLGSSSCGLICGVDKPTGSSDEPCTLVGKGLRSLRLFMNGLSLDALLVRCLGMGGMSRGTLHYRRASQRWALSAWSSSSGATPSAVASFCMVCG
jgi:hypothetical protein